MSSYRHTAAIGRFASTSIADVVFAGAGALDVHVVRDALADGCAAVANGACIWLRAADDAEFARTIGGQNYRLGRRRRVSAGGNPTPHDEVVQQQI